MTALPLAVYAHVNACVAEGFPLADVLALEGLTEPAWREADVANKLLVVDDKQAFEQYEVALATAEDKLAREVRPIDRNLAAWLAMLDAYAAAPAPGPFLQTLGLRLPDLARLKRMWDRRARDDASHEKKIVELRKAPLPPLPAIVVGESKLVRSSDVAPRAAPLQAPSEPGSATLASIVVDGIALVDFVPIAAELAEWPRADVLARRAFDEAQLARIESSFLEALAKEPALARDFHYLVEHHKKRLRSFGSGGRAPLPQPRPEAQVVTPPRAPVVAPPGAPVVARPPAALASTMGPALTPLAAALPFKASSQEAPLAASPAAPVEPAPESPFETTELVGPVITKTLPFKRKGGNAAIATAQNPASKAPSDLKETMKGVDLSKIVAALPFRPKDKPASAAAPPAKEEQAPAAHPAPKVPNALKETMKGVALTGLPRALPFAGGEKEKGKEPERETTPHATPADPRTGPRLTLLQYASMSMELSAKDAETSAVLARYGIGEDDKRAMDAHYGFLIAKDPRVRAAWEQACRRYLDWLQSQRR